MRGRHYLETIRCCVPDSAEQDCSVLEEAETTVVMPGECLALTNAVARIRNSLSQIDYEVSHSEEHRLVVAVRDPFLGREFSWYFCLRCALDHPPFS